MQLPISNEQIDSLLIIGAVSFSIVGGAAFGIVLLAFGVAMLTERKNAGDSIASVFVVTTGLAVLSLVTFVAWYFRNRIFLLVPYA